MVFDIFVAILLRYLKKQKKRRHSIDQQLRQSIDIQLLKLTLLIENKLLLKIVNKY